MKSDRDELVAEVVVALTDTLRDDFDVADMLYTLTTACVELLDVDAAGMLLIDEQGELVPVAATHDGSANLEKLQVMIREGPCLEAVRSIEPVHSVELTTPDDGPSSPGRPATKVSGRSTLSRSHCAARSSGV